MLRLASSCADRHAERMIAGRRQVGIVPGRIDRGHHREKTGAGVKLAGFGGRGMQCPRGGQKC